MKKLVKNKGIIMEEYIKFINLLNNNSEYISELSNIDFYPDINRPSVHLYFFTKNDSELCAEFLEDLGYEVIYKPFESADFIVYLNH
jgi:hypothetical protein